MYCRYTYCRHGWVRGNEAIQSKSVMPGEAAAYYLPIMYCMDAYASKVGLFGIVSSQTNPDATRPGSPGARQFFYFSLLNKTT